MSGILVGHVVFADA